MRNYELNKSFKAAEIFYMNMCSSIIQYVHVVTNRIIQIVTLF